MGQERVRQSFLIQAASCEKLGSLFMGRLCRVLHARLDDSTPAGAMAFGWPGDPSPSKDSVPLRLAGALHAVVLKEMDNGLVGAYPPHEVDDDLLWQAVNTVLHSCSAFICEWMQSPPQTNEVRRSSALYAGLCVISQFAGNRALTLLELGASAGLNLVCDAYGYRFDGHDYGNPDAALVMEPKWFGETPPPVKVKVTRRQGCDINPLDVTQEEDRLRMRSYVWADQPDRLERMDKAIAIALGGEAPFTLEQADAELWLRKNLMELPAAGRPRVVMHSIAWQYFPAATQAACRSVIDEAGANATAQEPLFQLSMEADDTGDRGAGLTLRSWPGSETRMLARVDFHGRWIDWRYCHEFAGRINPTLSILGHDRRN